MISLSRFLAERLTGDKASSSSMRKGRRDSNTSVASTLSQIGEKRDIKGHYRFFLRSAYCFWIH